MLPSIMSRHLGTVDSLAQRPPCPNQFGVVLVLVQPTAPSSGSATSQEHSGAFAGSAAACGSAGTADEPLSAAGTVVIPYGDAEWTGPVCNSSGLHTPSETKSAFMRYT